jgi:hypothetical protein
MAERHALSPLLLLRVPEGDNGLQQLCRDHEIEEGVKFNRYDERLDGPLETLNDFLDLLKSKEFIWIAH